MSTPDLEQRVFEAAAEIASSSPGHPVQVDAIAAATGVDAAELQQALKALYSQGKFNAIIGEDPVTAVSLET